MNYEELESLLAEAKAESSKSNYAEAEALCNLALDKIPVLPTQEADKSDLTEEYIITVNLRAKVLSQLSVSLYSLGKVREAILSSEEGLRLCAQTKDSPVEAGLLNSLANSYYLLSDYPHAMEYYSKALVMYETIGNKLGISSIIGNIGMVYSSLSDYPRSLEYLTKALAINEESGNKSGIAFNAALIGSVYLALSDYPRALEYYKKALTIAEEIGNITGVALNNGHIGNYYFSLSDYPMALEFYTKELELHEKTGYRRGLANTIGNIGNLYVKLYDYHRALEFYTKALAINEEIKENASIAINIGDIGTLYALKAFEGYDANKAENYLLKALNMHEEMGGNDYSIHKTLAELYEQESDSEKALEHFKRFHDLKEEVNSEEAKKQAELLEQKRMADEREKEIEIAKATAAAQLNATSTLLHRVLPESISTRMINGEENISDYFPSVSILFADIQGFTAISANMKAIDVVRFLNFVFGEFDRIMKTHGCEKIKTIGDGYMAVAGAPIECEDHAERLAAAALEMQETIHLPEDIRSTMPKGARFGIRIGLHTGSVVAGVIGQERFVYDIHSDAVNLASRMESSGEVDRVHVSSDFAEHLQARFKQTKNTKHGIHFEDRGETNIKGKGMMKTYFIEKVT